MIMIVTSLVELEIEQFHGDRAPDILQMLRGVSFQIGQLISFVLAVSLLDRFEPLSSSF